MLKPGAWTGGSLEPNPRYPGALMRAISQNLHGPFTGLQGSGSLDLHGPRIEDVFDAWVFAAEDAKLALDEWAMSTFDTRGDAFAAYRAALDREERAAAVLAESVAQAA